MSRRRLTAVLPGCSILLGAVLLANAGPALAGTPARSCFRAADVSGWAAVGRTGVNLRVGVRDYYQIRFMGACGNIDFSERIGVESRGSDYICTGLDVTIIAPTSLGPQRCAARSLRKLTPAEVAALPPRQRP